MTFGFDVRSPFPKTRKRLRATQGIERIQPRTDAALDPLRHRVRPGPESRHHGGEQVQAGVRPNVALTLLPSICDQALQCGARLISSPSLCTPCNQAAEEHRGVRAAGRPEPVWRGGCPIVCVSCAMGVALSGFSASSTIRRVASFTSSARPSADDKRPSIRSERDSRVRIDAGTLFATGCLLAGAGGNRHRFMNPQRGCTPTKISSNSRTSPSPIVGGTK